MSRLPPFARPGSILRFHAGTEEFPTLKRKPDTARYLRLEEGEGPLKLTWEFANIGTDAISDFKNFEDLTMDPNHVAQVFMGVSFGARARFYLPFDTRKLKWDESDLDVDEDATANIEYEDSPFDAPTFNFWVAPTENFVPGVEIQSTMNFQRPNRSLDARIIFLAQKYRFTLLTAEQHPDILDRIDNGAIPFTVGSFGGRV